MNNKPMTEMTESDFLDLILDKEIPEARPGMEFKSVVIVPPGIKHDSGFGVMFFVLFDENDNPIAKGTYGSDVVNICGEFGNSKTSIDCLPCGFVRVFSTYHNFIKLIFNVSCFSFMVTEKPTSPM